MRYRLLCVGRIRERYIADAARDFAQRLRRYEPLEITEVPATRGLDEARARREEGDALLRRIVPGETVWLLERTGNEFSSLDLVSRLKTLSASGTSRLTLVVAGPYGASSNLLQRADFLWSLSQLTLLHEWARALVLEQLYRAAKIVRREPYHH